MRYFFGSFPGTKDVLLIESGSPAVGLLVLEKIREIFPDARYHLLTCLRETPEQRAGGYQSVFRAFDYPSGIDKLRLLFSLARRRWRVLAILCTGEQILLRWKLLALAIFPSKVLIANENADFFWLDWANRGSLRQLLGVRWGVNRGELTATLLRALVLPFTLLFLMLTALWLYSRRWRRLLYWKLRPAAAESRSPIDLPKPRSF